MDIFCFSALSRVFGLSTVERAKIFTERDAFEAFISRHWNLLQDKKVCKELAKLDLEKCREEDERAIESGVRIVPYPDPQYPEMLKHIPDPPPCLYIRGDAAVLSKPCVAVVGSRAASVYGLNVAETLAKDLVLRGLTVVSGLARGIDSAAHKGSLAAEKAQAAVLGTGIDLCYPRENRQLMENILQNGGVILTELPPGTSPHKKNFPARNRIISGVSWGTIIVEAEEFSGSLVTARFALETGRELFCVPHNITSRGGVGPNAMIQQGAKLVMRAEDVIEELPPHLTSRLADYDNPPGKEKIPVTGLGDEERRVLSLLRPDEEKSLDGLIEESGLPAGRLLSVLSSLKIKNLCTELPGGRYSCRVFERR